MKESVSSALMEYDFEENKVLEALIDAFSSTFSLRDIASAYCKAGRNPDMAAQFLYDGRQKLNNNCSDAASVLRTTQCEKIKLLLTTQIGVQTIGILRHQNRKSWPFQLVLFTVLLVTGAMPNTPAWGPVSCIWPSLSETLCESVAYKPNRVADKGSMASKPKNLALSVSSSGEGYVMRNTPAYGPVSTTKPLKLNIKDLQFEELIDKMFHQIQQQRRTKCIQVLWKPGKIFVGGISREANEDTLKDHFNKFGEVVQTNILRYRNTGSARGFGFVLFSDKSVADKVLLEKHVILGKTVDVGKVVLRGKHNNPYNQKGFNKSSGNNGQFRTKKIFVGGLSPSLTEEEFKAYFEKFGRTTDVVIMYNFSTHRPRGFGFITFDSEEAVENVMQKRFHELNDKVVEVKRCLPKDGSKNGHNGGYNVRANAGRGGSLWSSRLRRNPNCIRQKSTMI
ncbi:hypothetical protein MKX01_017786 [Papaver californicum]|nr:hypothetical protein MKX01_017786 [Papaver californicum]